jgi:hypothetical protein
MVGQVAQQRIEFFLREPGIVEGQSVALQNAMQQPQAVGPGQTVQLLPQGAAQAGLAGAAGDQQAAAPGTGGQVVKEIGQPPAYA